MFLQFKPPTKTYCPKRNSIFAHTMNDENSRRQALIRNATHAPRRRLRTKPIALNDRLPNGRTLQEQFDYESTLTTPDTVDYGPIFYTRSQFKALPYFKQRLYREYRRDLNYARRYPRKVPIPFN